MNDKLKNKVIVTGSRVYGVVNKDSDIDIVMRVDKALNLRDHLEKKLGVVTTDAKHIDQTYEGFSFTLPHLPRIQIISVLDEVDLMTWQTATEQMTRNMKGDKKRKIAKFQELRKEARYDLLFRGVI